MNFTQTTVPDSDYHHDIAAEADRWQETKPYVEKDYITRVTQGQIYRTMILMGKGGHERLIDLVSNSERFVDIVKIIRSYPRYRGWEILESWQAKDEF